MMVKCGPRLLSGRDITVSDQNKQAQADDTFVPSRQKFPNAEPINST